MIGCVILCAALAASGQQLLGGPVSVEAALLKERDELQTAIVRDDVARIRAFIRAGRSVDFDFDEGHTRQLTRESPLTMAVNRNKLEVARLLLDAGASANRPDGFGRAPIHLVKTADMARLLVKAGADPNALNSRGYTGLAEAVWDGQLDRVDALLAAGARFDAPAKNPDVFTIAVQMRKSDLIPALVARGADPRRPPTQVLGPLIDAGDTPAAVALVRAGADPNARNQFAPVLLVALFRKRWEVAEALADAGANLNPADPPQCGGGYGCWSIQAARLASFQPPTLKKLASRGLDLNRVATDGHTALTSLIVEEPLAVRAVVSTTGARAEIPAPDNIARVREVLAAGANPNVKYGEETPLMLAVERGGAFGDVVFDAADGSSIRKSSRPTCPRRCRRSRRGARRGNRRTSTIAA
jgi:ankyrin repeat protein